MLLQVLGRSNGEEDRMVWKASKSEGFSVKYFYSTLELEGKMFHFRESVVPLGSY